MNLEIKNALQAFFQYDSNVKKAVNEKEIEDSRLNRIRDTHEDNRRYLYTHLSYSADTTVYRLNRPRKFRSYLKSLSEGHDKNNLKKRVVSALPATYKENINLDEHEATFIKYESEINEQIKKHNKFISYTKFISVYTFIGVIPLICSILFMPIVINFIFNSDNFLSNLLSDLLDKNEILAIFLLSILILGLVSVFVAFYICFSYNKRKEPKWQYKCKKFAEELNEIYLNLNGEIQENAVNPYIDKLRREIIEKQTDNLVQMYTKTAQYKVEYEKGEHILPQEVVNMYNQLAPTEQQLFITLGMNADSYKEFSQIFLECKNREDSRKIVESNYARLNEAKKQTLYAQNAADEARRRAELEAETLREQQLQSKILADQAAQQAAYNAQMLKKQDEANKLAKKISQETSKTSQRLDESNREYREFKDKYGL